MALSNAERGDCLLGVVGLRKEGGGGVIGLEEGLDGLGHEGLGLDGVDRDIQSGGGAEGAGARAGGHDHMLGPYRGAVRQHDAGTDATLHQKGGDGGKLPDL